MGQVVGKLEIGGDHQKAFRIGEAFKVDAEAPSYGTPGPICTDQVVGLELVGLALGVDAGLHRIC